jgi:DNA primase
MDTISLHQHGIKNVVATMGTALSEEHARTISRYFKDVIISFDSDEAGKAAAIRGMDILLSAGCRVKILNLGEMKDPDDYIKAKGLHKFKKAISESDSVLDYRMKLLKQTHDINSLEGKIDFVNEIAKTLTKIENTIELDAYIQKISEDTKISKQAIYAQMKKISAKNNLKEKKTRKILRETSNVKSDNLFIPNKNKSNIDSAEEMLLNIIVSDAKVFNEVKDFIKAYTFNNSVIQKACDTVILLREKKRNILPSEILSHFTNKSDIDHIASILHKETGFEDNHKAAMQIINTINKNIMMDTIKDNINEGNVEKLKTLLQYKYKQS